MEKVLFCDIDGILTWNLNYSIGQAHLLGYGKLSLNNNSHSHLIKDGKPVVSITKLIEEDYYKNVKPVISASHVLKRLAKHGWLIHLLTKRPASFKTQTTEWLLKYNFPYPVIYLKDEFERAKFILKHKPIFMVEDEVLNLNKMIKLKVYENTKILKYLKPYNSYYTNDHIMTVGNWREIEEVITK